MLAMGSLFYDMADRERTCELVKLSGPRSTMSAASCTCGHGCGCVSARTQVTINASPPSSCCMHAQVTVCAPPHMLHVVFHHCGHLMLM